MPPADLIPDGAPPRYEHTQPAHVIRWSVGGAAALTVALMAALARSPEAAPALVILGITLVLFAATLVLFWSLTVRVTGEALDWRFGPGLIRKRVPLADIASCEPARTGFWAGWGIHWTPRGWVYNVSGYGAVEVHLKSGKALRLGTDEPEALAEAIRDALSP